jgi:multicomponent Na+:H+ antiporter subunit F
MIVAALVLLTAGALFFFVRLLKGPSLASRVVALDGIVATIVSAIAALSAKWGHAKFLDVMVVVALIGFVATSAVALFIEERGG